jgi:hypothetical protein
LIVVTVFFGVRCTYSPAVHHSLAAVQIAVIAWAAWTLGASAIRSETEERRQLAVAGAMLILPWALFSLLAGFGPPWLATAPENYLRYVVLFAGASSIAVGFVLLRGALGEAGERFYSTLGFTAILLASSLYLVWASILIEACSAKDLVSSSPLPPWAHFLFELSDVLLFFGAALTYIATAAFAASLGRTRWLGRRASRAFVWTSLVGLLCLVVRGLQFPDPTAAFANWYDVPGFVAGIPAIPWIMPVLFGMTLLRRAGDEPARA